MGPEWDLKRFNRRVRQLRKDFPAICRVVIKLCPIGSIRDAEGNRLHGVTIFHPKSFEIRVEREEDISHSISTLWHEYSHCLEPPGRKCHHERWRDMHHKIITHYNGD